MALDDLDLEFEDEEEAKKKKSDAVQQDVDLEFHIQDDGPKPRSARPAGANAPAPAQAVGIASARPGPVSEHSARVRKIEEARAAAPQAIKRPTAVANAPTSGANAMKVQPASEGQYDLESEEIVALRERARKAEFDAEVKVQVAEFKTELLTELLSDMKLMDHQVNQLLVRINAKHPDMKQEVLMIKKLLADFTAKKRK
jgi:hypothetical protein